MSKIVQAKKQPEEMFNLVHWLLEGQRKKIYRVPLRGKNGGHGSRGSQREKNEAKVRDRQSQEVKRRLQRTARARLESQKRRRGVTTFRVGNGDLCGRKTGLFPLIWGSSCTPATPPALHTLNYSDIYADTKTWHFFAAFSPLSAFPPCLTLPHHPFLTIAGTQRVCGVRLSIRY